MKKLFDEEFPSLKDKKQIEGCIYTDGKGKTDEYLGFTKKDLMDNCVDKQKLKEVIEKLKENENIIKCREKYKSDLINQNQDIKTFHPYDFMVAYITALKLLEKELGL